jgi:hypothetical protein
VASDGEALEVPGDARGVDGAQLNKEKTGVWLTSSLASSSEVERRLEEARVPVCYGCG